jgi:hypothetical protein
VFAEEKIELPIGETNLELQAGVRFNKILDDDQFVIDHLSAWEPRFNARYVMVENGKKIKHLSIRGGWGLNYKMPTMSYLFPEPYYYDRLMFSYQDPANSYGFALFNVDKITNNANPDLKMPRSANTEICTEFTIGNVSGSLVYINENLTNSYTVQRIFDTYRYRRYGMDANGNVISYGSGQQFYYDYASSGGMLYQRADGGDIPVSYFNDSTFLRYNMAANDYEVKKWGIEYTLNFGTIQTLKTEVIVDGAYFQEFRKNVGVLGRVPSGTSAGDRYPYVAYYGGTSSQPYNATLNDRFNTNIRFVTHSPKVSMVATLTAQFVLYQSSQNRSDYDGQIQTYYYDANNVRHSGEEVYSDDKYVKRLNPMYLVDMNGNTIPFTQSMELDTKYQELILRSNVGNSMLKQRYSPYALFNIRLTKEIKNRMTVSFFANNFLSIIGNQKNYVTNTYIERNPSMYFGAEIKVKL